MPMLMPDVSSWVLLCFVAAVILLTDRFPAKDEYTLNARAGRTVCAAAVVLGCAARLWRLAALPAGLSAEEALVAVQARSLWQTGGFFGQGAFSAQIAQWSGESAGPLLPILTAPFVGLFGMRPWAVRLPLALLSCAALPAACGAGREVAGERGGRWMLIIYALSPIFIMTARLTAAASVSLALAPMALWCSLRALKDDGWTVPACALLGLLCWSQDLYFYLSPALIVLLTALVLCRRRDGRRLWLPLAAAALGLALCLPGVLTAFASRPGGVDIRLGPVLCPHLEPYDKSKTLLPSLAASKHPELPLLEKLWGILQAGIFQDIMHDNIAQGLFMPDGQTALYFFGVPLALLGAFSLFVRRLARRPEDPLRLALLFGFVTLACEVVIGSTGVLERYGATSVWDHSQMFPYTALLITAGLCRVERRGARGTAAMLAAYAVSFSLTLGWLFGGGYAEGANVYFPDFAEAVARAGELHRQTGEPLRVTASVYPHRAPDEAALIMSLYTQDADMRTAAGDPEAYGTVIWAEGQESPEEGAVSVVSTKELQGWMWDSAAFAYEEYGRYALLYPRQDP